MASPEINEIMSGPLVQWFASCLDDPHTLTDYNDLVDGVLLHRVYLQIDPEPLHDHVEPTCGKAAQRVKNLETVVANIKQFYDGQLGHLMLRQPDTTNLGREPESHLPDAQLLLLLLLGCAVQCENKELFITRIKSLNLETQLALVDCIKQVTDQSDIVITEDALVTASGSVVFGQFKYLLQERDLYKEKWKASTLSDMFEAEDENENSYDKAKCKLARETNRHLAVELADWKSKMRKQRQKLDEKTEALLECKEELEHCKVSLAKLKQENQELLQAARTVQSYKDELDAVIERADRADRLELEVQRYREKLTDMEFYKTRIEELREDNRVLIENREMLEEQLRSSRRNTEKLLELQTQIIEYEKLINEMTLEHAANKEKYEELLEENCELSRLKKAAADEVALAGLANENEEPATADSSLSEQLTNNAQTRALKLELENRRLMTIIDSLEENWYNKTTSRVIELQRGKNKFSSRFDAPSNDKENLPHHNCDLELVCKEALEENKKLQNILKNQRNSFERQAEDYQAQRNKIVKLDNNYEAVTKEKKKMQLLLESARRRADDLDKSLEISNQQLEELNGTRLRAKKAEAKCNELETALAVSEKEKEYSLRDNKKCRRIIEVKDIALDKSTDHVEVLEKRVAQFKEEIKNLVTEVTRLQGIEKSYEELNSRVTSDREALENLESSLVAEKLNSQQFYEIFGKLGLDVQSTLTTLSLENILERISNIPEVIDLVNRTIVGEVRRDGTRAEPESDGSVYVASVTKNLQDIIDSQKKEIESLLTKTRVIQATADHLKCEKTKLEVSLTTLQSQSTSRTSQRAALQLTNSQLIAEKQELLKDCLANERAHFQVVNDQATLQTLHEQLNREYENILHERETLKANLRDAKNTVRTLRETCRRLETEKKLLNAGKKTAIANANCLSNLRLEHSKLEEDFINLYTSTDQLKAEYANLQENYARNKTEMNRLSLEQTEMQGELSASNDKCAAMELEINKLNQTSKMLLQVNSGLESNRKSLMTHLSLLFTQYHELLTHSFEDKEHYHTEEKLYTDKVNHLYRQKEKLEEKIMDHYRKMESCSAKKKKFGANLVRRVRKAGSELLSMNRRSWADDSSKQSENGKTYEFESGENDSDASSDDKRAAEPVQLPELNDKISRWVIQEL